MGAGRSSVFHAALVFGLAQTGMAAVPADGMCAADADSAGGISIPASAARREHAPASDCRIDAASLVANAAPRVLVDVRPAKETAIASIPGAVNLGLESLASHLLVKAAAQVVLIGDGRNTPRLLRQCAQLRARGLPQIAVLDGGLPAWRRAGGTVAGDASSLDQPLQLGERDLHEILHQPDAVLVLAQGRPTPALAASGARLVHANAKAGPTKALLDRVPSAVARKTAVVIVLQDGRDANAWRVAVRARGWAEPLFFVGEVSRYDAYLEQQARIAEAARQPKPGTCEQG